MAKLGVLTIPGKSGTKYKFDAYPLTTVWTPISAVYLTTHRQVLLNGTAEHTCVELGQLNNLQHLAQTPAASTQLRPPNCICILQEENEPRRKAIVEDIANARSIPLQ